jgi:hypothetical protein
VVVRQGRLAGQLVCQLEANFRAGLSASWSAAGAGVASPAGAAVLGAAEPEQAATQAAMTMA